MVARLYRMHNGMIRNVRLLNRIGEALHHPGTEVDGRG